MGYISPFALAVLTVTVLTINTHVHATPLRIGAFNIQIFGDSKMNKPGVPAALVDILKTYEVVLIQEIRAKTQDAINELLSLLNQKVAPKKYAMKISGRLGTTSSKEQYAYFYRTDLFKVINEYQFPESQKLFERPPYIVTFQAQSSVIGTFAFLGIHTKPDDKSTRKTVKEIDNLVTVYDQCRKGAGGPVPTDDWIFAGDFNADGLFVKPTEWNNIRLWTDNRFSWEINTGVDTMVDSKVAKTYDRIVLTSRLESNKVTGSAKAYDFQKVLGLSTTFALTVSDHRPVEIEIN